LPFWRTNPKEVNSPFIKNPIKLSKKLPCQRLISNHRLSPALQPFSLESYHLFQVPLFTSEVGFTRLPQLKSIVPLSDHYSWAGSPSDYPSSAEALDLLPLPSPVSTFPVPPSHTLAA
jgi:hypothetical protein